MAELIWKSNQTFRKDMWASPHGTEPPRAVHQQSNVQINPNFKVCLSMDCWHIKEKMYLLLCFDLTLFPEVWGGISAPHYPRSFNLVRLIGPKDNNWFKFPGKVEIWTWVFLVLDQRCNNDTILALASSLTVRAIETCLPDYVHTYLGSVPYSMHRLLPHY